jgi:hypothetical protein
MRRDVLTLHRGADWAATWPLLDADGQPWTWQTGDTVHGQLRAEHAAGQLLHEWTDAASGVDTTVTGQLTLRIGYAISEPWTAARAVADVEITRAGIRARPIGFTLLVDRDITV